MTEAEAKAATPGPGVNGDVPSDVEPDVATVLTQRDEYLDQLQRSRAEFANFRRRTEQERLALRDRANQDLLKQVLPVLDDLQRALANVPADQAESAFVHGVQMVERKFMGALERAGVAPLEAMGQPFDPSLHEAVDIVPGSTASTVVDVFQPGYRLGSTLLRPAIVRVGDPTGEAAANVQVDADEAARG